MNNRIPTILLVLLVFIIITPSAQGDQVRVFQIQYRTAEEMLETVKAALSEKGSVTVDKRTNSLVVRDSAAGIRNVEKLLATVDVAPVNVSITVAQIGETEMENLGVKVNWARRDGRWAVGNIEKNTDGTFVGMTAAKKIHSSSFAARRKLVVMSGAKGTWTIGNRTYVHGSNAGWSQKLGVWVKEVGATHVQPEFVIEPVVRGDQVMLTITPGAKLFSKANIENRQYGNAQLTTTVKDGGVVLIGSDQTGSMSEVTEVLQGFSKTQGTSSSFLLIEVSIIK